MRMVITGSESFIGQELQRHCARVGIEVIGIDTASPPVAQQIVEDIRSPILEHAIPYQADVLVHLAAVSRTEDCQTDPQRAFDINVCGTLNVIQAAQTKQVKQIIFASSEWVYGEVKNADTQLEDAVIDVNTIDSEYALTKLMGERALYFAHQRGLCPVTVLRFGIVYGPRPNHWCAVESLFHTVRTQEVVEVNRSIQTARRFIHVSDIARGILSAVGKNEYEIFNLSGNTLISLGDIINESMRFLQRQVRIVEHFPHSVSIRNPDNQKAKTRLGWEPTVGLREGLETLLLDAHPAHA